jgi:hypothetical protein
LKTFEISIINHGSNFNWTFTPDFVYFDGGMTPNRESYHEIWIIKKEFPEGHDGGCHRADNPRELRHDGEKAPKS